MQARINLIESSGIAKEFNKNIIKYFNSSHEAKLHSQEKEWQKKNIRKAN